jgi:hypothetical protein
LHERIHCNIFFFFFFFFFVEKMEMTIVLPLSKVPTQSWDARFTIVGLIERCSLPLASGSAFCTILTVSDGWFFAVVCVSLPGWEGHPKCVRRGDIMVLRCCRRSKGTNDWLVLKGVAAQWILVCGEMGESQEDPKCLTDAEALVVKQLRLLVGSGVLGFTFSTRFYPQAFVPLAVKRAKDASLVFLPPLYKHLEQLFRPGHEEGLSFDAVQVTLFWPFHESSWCAVLWDGYGCGFWAAVLDVKVVSIVHDSITFCNGWIKIKSATLQARITDGLPELLLEDVLAISPMHHDEVLTRLEHKEAFGPCHVPAPRPRVLAGWHNYMWHCCACDCTSYWPKVFCYCCGKRFDILYDSVFEKK